ncbi:MAG: TIGR01777 family oxidoreductase [Vicingaceae bacterium]
MKKVLISGGSGLVGTKLSAMLVKKGYEVAHLSRSSDSISPDIKTIVWDVEKMQLNAKDIAEYDHIIHLAGAGIVDEPWTEKRKKVILDSRTRSAELLKNAIAQNEKKPDSFVSASAVGYYGFVTTDHIFKESDEPGNDFLADTCLAWENAVDEIGQLDIPTSKIRIGLVMSDQGGALKEMAKPIKFGFGAALGSGKQYMPWIHIEDLCRIFIHAMENKLSGAFNAAAPADNQVNNSVFIKAVAKSLKKPLWLPNVPAFVMKIMLGSRALLVLEGSRVDSNRIQAKGFEFKHEKLNEALEAIYG